MSLKAVRDILNSHINTVVSGFGYITGSFGSLTVTFGDGVAPPLTGEIAWENSSFTPDTNGSHIRVNFIPVESVATARFKTSMVREKGIYQIDVYGKQGIGTNEIDVLVENIRAHFNRGRTLTDAYGNTVHIENTPKISQGRREAGFYRVTIIVDWFAHFTQP